MGNVVQSVNVWKGDRLASGVAVPTNNGAATLVPKIQFWQLDAQDCGLDFIHATVAALGPCGMVFHLPAVLSQLAQCAGMRIAICYNGASVSEAAQILCRIETVAAE